MRRDLRSIGAPGIVPKPIPADRTEGNTAVASLVGAHLDSRVNLVSARDRSGNDL